MERSGGAALPDRRRTAAPEAAYASTIARSIGTPIQPAVDDATLPGIHQLQQPMQLRRRRGDLRAIEPGDLRDLAELGLHLPARDAPGEDEAHVASLPRIDEQQPIHIHLQPRLLPRLASGRRMRCLAMLDATAREHPPRAKVGGAHHEDAAVRIDG